MDLMQRFFEKAKSNPKRIIYPEGHDERIVAAAIKAKQMGLANPLIFGDEQKIRQNAAKSGLPMDGIEILAPDDENRINRYAEAYSGFRDIRLAIAKKLVAKPLAFCCMAVRQNDADGMVGGVDSATGSVIQAATLAVGYQEGLSTSSSFFIMIVPEFLGEKDKVFVFADCAVSVAPTSRQLADIAIASGTNAKNLLGMEPKIAFLSFSTKGSAYHENVDKVIEALKIARELKPEFQMDGELQGDAAIVPRVAQKKVKESAIAGNANVLVFPDLNAGNICYKLVQYLANAKAIGPVLQGFAKPVNDLSRGATVEDIIAVTAITVVQAQGGSK